MKLGSHNMKICTKVVMNPKHSLLYTSGSLGAGEGSFGLMLGGVGERLNLGQARKEVRGRRRACQSPEKSKLGQVDLDRGSFDFSGAGTRHLG